MVTWAIEIERGGGGTKSRMGDPWPRKVSMKFSFLLLLPPATKLGQGYIFTGVCDSVQIGGGVPDPGGAYPGGCLVLVGCAKTPPPRDSYCCGRYASYWNAFLFFFSIAKCISPIKILSSRTRHIESCLLDVHM